MRYRLRTLLILLAVGPPIVAMLWTDSSLAVALGWLGVIIFALLASMSDSRQRSGSGDD
jgi:hypothetical protein